MDETARGDFDDYVVKEYVLERRRPDPTPGVATYNYALTADELLEQEAFPPGEYLLQEIKETGTAGAVIWEAGHVVPE